VAQSWMLLYILFAGGKSDSGNTSIIGVIVATSE
jgi:hypothetical protein